MAASAYHSRTASVDSAVATEAHHDDNEKYRSSFEESENDRISQHTAVEDRDGHEEEGLLEKDAAAEVTQAPEKDSGGMTKAVVWMVINTLATIGIVFTNKAIFSDPTLKLAQLSFAGFHFFITWLTLYVLSRPQLAFFVPRRTTIREIIPLSISMSLNVILPNLSLAFSSVTFYQVARILLTPTVALMNFVLYRATLPRNAILALIPACVGVGMVSYYDSLPTDDVNVKTTTGLGVIFAFAGIFASSLYTVWIASYHRKLQMTSMQLLFNQAPVSAFLLLYVIPFVDTFPVWSEVPINRWVMIMMSGVFASLINISQFFIIAKTGPVSSTVVGHLKTCTIVALGWATSGRSVGDKSVMGVFVAVGGIIARNAMSSLSATGAITFRISWKLHVSSYDSWKNPKDPSIRDEYLAICLAVRDQALDLPEFLQHHYYNMGIKRIYILDDGSSPPLKASLDTYGVPSSALTFVYYDETQRVGQMQYKMYNDCAQIHGQNHTWLAFIDADEFFDTPGGESYESVLRDLEVNRGHDVGALGVNWQMHTSNGQLHRAPSVRKAYTQCIYDDPDHDGDLSDNKHVKSIVRVRDYAGPINQHVFNLARGKITVGEDGKDIAHWAFRRPITRDRLSLHHYAVKSKEEYEEKMMRSNAMGQPKTWDFWNHVEHDLPHVSCEDMLRWVE
ncbi:integral membrane protein [Seiridium cupressi]